MYNVHALQTVALREGPEKEIEVCEGMSRWEKSVCVHIDFII